MHHHKGFRPIRVRWHADRPPMPLGCRWCGHPPYAHEAASLPHRTHHDWHQPTTAQVHARMSVRRRLGLGGRPPAVTPPRPAHPGTPPHRPESPPRPPYRPSLPPPGPGTPPPHRPEPPILSPGRHRRLERPATPATGPYRHGRPPGTRPPSDARGPYGKEVTV
ncbi:hypothetical protein OHA77_27400 [Streptosporangium sp. NBC_01639]|uniref:hypothetical protein n=1 Tax=Streptosporangium sp. NBC_01639 TaxID=2975948 RepID=UPI0038640E9D|nr:hypothetical protein OHA77_27400 [Streptosporangium sp. NBC_01639]